MVLVNLGWKITVHSPLEVPKLIDVFLFKRRQGTSRWSHSGDAPGYRLVIQQCAIENGHGDDSEFSRQKMVIFHRYVNVYQRLAS